LFPTTPAARGLSTISPGVGSGEEYRVLDGGGRFAGFKRHPEREGRRRCASAADALQAFFRRKLERQRLLTAA
jgi:hypothetical protein